MAAVTSADDVEDDQVDDEPQHVLLSFPPNVQCAIDQVLPSTDPLDQADFNPVDYINTLFPTEQSLTNIDEVMGRMDMKIRQLDEEIRTVVRGQTSAGHDGRQALDEAHKAILQLFSQIKDIKEKAEKSEQMVKEITRDIKQLDHAKKNLTASITTLNHFEILFEGVNNLQSLAKKKQYAEVANLLQGVMNVLDHFQKHIAIAQIKQLYDQAHAIRAELAEQITAEFQNAFAGPNAKHFIPNQQIAEACLVVSVLDSKVKRDLLKWFVTLQLAEYTHLFQENQDVAWLDKIEKRFTWLKKHLMEFEEKFGRIFPPEWEVSERIAVEFCEITRFSLTKVMSNRIHEMDVRLLLFAIQKTTNFESLLSKKFTGITLEGASASLLFRPTVNTKKAPAQPTSTNPFEESLNPFEDDMENEAAEKITEQQTTLDSVHVTLNKTKLNPFQGIISKCFERHLTIYIESQDKNLSQLMDRLVEDMQKGNLPRAEEGAAVLPSCADLFVFYKKCLVQCTQLSTGQPMVDLAATFRKYLKDYAVRVLQNSLPKVGAVTLQLNATSAAGLIKNVQSFLKEGEETRLSPAELCRICSILTTAEYCLETTQQLEGKLKEKIDPPLADQINLVAEQDVFHGVITNCIQLLVQDLEGACDSSLNVMVKTSWFSVETVGDQSGYVTAITSHWRQTIPLLRDNLDTSRKYFTQFCNKFASSFILKFIANLFKCKPVSAVGAEQLLLDTHMLKTVLLDLPLLGSQINRKAPGVYTKTVVKGMTKAEMILKIVMAPHDYPKDFVENFMKLLPESDLSEFQKVLDMKGLKRSEQNTMIEMFRSHHPVAAAAMDMGGVALFETRILPSSVASLLSSPEHESSKIKHLEKLIKKRR